MRIAARGSAGALVNVKRDPEKQAKVNPGRSKDEKAVIYAGSYFRGDLIPRYSPSQSPFRVLRTQLISRYFATCLACSIPELLALRQSCSGETGTIGLIIFPHPQFFSVFVLIGRGLLGFAQGIPGVSLSAGFSLTQWVRKQQVIGFFDQWNGKDFEICTKCLIFCKQGTCFATKHHCTAAMRSLFQLGQQLVSASSTIINGDIEGF
ncbi:MAG: hypothetical protein U5M23_08595 [Marinagarivorans sp.]|nr:hypothetical protein [Marinagarivorans sp.]